MAAPAHEHVSRSTWQFLLNRLTLCPCECFREISMRLRVLLVVFVGACLLQGSENLWAQSFDGGSITNNGYSSSTGQSGVISWGPGPATDVEQSAGQFTIVVNPAYASSSLLTMLPLPDPSNPYAASYDPSTDRLTSGFLYDQVRRSAAALRRRWEVPITSAVCRSVVLLVPSLPIAAFRLILPLIPRPRPERAWSLPNSTP